MLLGAASTLPCFFSAERDLLAHQPWMRDAYLESPIVVRAFSAPLDWMHYWYVPFVHPTSGIALNLRYGRLRDWKSGNEVLKMDSHHGVITRDRPSYLIRAEKARGLVQESLGIRLWRDPLEVSVAAENLRNRVGDELGWFWYLRCDEGFEQDGRTVHSIFVIPLALVRDVASVGLDELADDDSARGAMLALAKHRAYTIEGKDIHLCALDEAQRMAGFAPASREKGTPLYLPSLTFVPVRLAMLSASED